MHDSQRRLFRTIFLRYLGPLLTPDNARAGSDLESHLDGLRSEPAHCRFSMQELDGGLVILDISYSTDGLVYDIRC